MQIEHSEEQIAWPYPRNTHVMYASPEVFSLLSRSGLN